MAYFLRYQGVFSNDEQQTVDVQILQKDVEEDVEPFEVIALELSDSSDEGTIIAREMLLTLGAELDNNITWETFLTGSYDEWKVIITVDSMPFFHGFLTPEEGNSPFLDKPYNITVRATGGLKLIKSVDLTTLSGVKFKGKYTLMQFLTAALSKTLLDLPIRIYGTVYNEGMITRVTDASANYWHQAKMDHRSFMQDALQFQSCYDSMLILLERHSRLFYWNGMWVVYFLGEHQYRPGGLWYTDYDKDGAVINSGLVTEGYATVGKTEILYPINEDALVKSTFAIKFAKTQFNYDDWDELPLNNKFEYGTLFETGVALDDLDDDNDGNTTEVIGTYEKYTIDDWTAGMVDWSAGVPFTLSATEGDTYTKRVFNPYGMELRREVFMETPTTVDAGGSIAKVLLAEVIPVNSGDKIRISNSVRFDNDFTGSGDSFTIIGRVILIPDAGTIPFYALDNNIGGQETSEGRWVADAVPNFISIDLPEDSNSKKYHNITIEADAMPTNGTLYIYLQHANDGSNPGGNKWFTGFELEYLPFSVNGYLPVKGDFWKHTQDANQLDKDEATVRMSDTIIRVLKGCIFKFDGITATNADWYRYGIEESRHWKEIVNMVRYNLGYRRFNAIEGSFTGLVFSPINDTINFQPIGYHKEYRFLDPAVQRDYILVAPLSMDLCTAQITAHFEEVVNPELTTNYGADMYNVVGGIISAVQLLGVGFTGERMPPDDRMLKIISNSGDTVTDITVDAGGAGNSPSLTLNTQFTDGGNNIAYLTVGEDLAINNNFYFKVGGQDVFYTVVDIILQSDGTQPGDQQQFSYVFNKTNS